VDYNSKTCGPCQYLFQHTIESLKEIAGYLA
jgi:hypothetical protein